MKRQENTLAYNLAEAAVACRISKPTMAKLVHNKEIQSIRIGRRIIISREALQAFLNGGQR